MSKLHKDLISEKQVDITKLSAKTQKLIKKYDEMVEGDEPDDDEIEALDESIWQQVTDYVEERDAAAKEEEEKKPAETATAAEPAEKPKEEEKKPATANFPTAAKPAEPAPADKEKSFTERFFNR